MKLHDLKPNEGKVRPRRRVGRGTGSGDGKTSGRGTKGQGARAGGGTGLYHQGGNLPFYRRLPFKRGFNKPFQQTYNEVNLDQLADFKANSEISPETLDAAKLLRNPENPIVVLGRGDVKAALKVRVHRVTAGAKAKIEKAGGSVELMGAALPTEPKAEAKAAPAKVKKTASKKTAKKKASK
jgi:large subunit ribosomal protein L15